MDLYRFQPADLVARLQAKFVKRFVQTGARSVLDLGCGRGIFLRLLRDAGIDGVGVDASVDAIELCRQQGFTAIHGDAVDVLEQLRRAGNAYGGVFCSHLVEHLPGDRIELLVRRSAGILVPDGLLIVVTPNAENLQVLTESFWLDVTHVRPVPRLLLETMMADAGMRVIETGTDAETADLRRTAPWWRKSLWRVVLGRTVAERHLLSGLDSYVVGQRVDEGGRT
jgi:O-antigen chain-terminating methyltransferase